MLKNSTDKQKNVTIADVAAYVGVSKTTISRYLNKNFEFMSQETQEKIDEAIKVLKYRPNRIAQTLKAKNSNIIGVTIADIGNPFSSLLIKGINDVCRANNYQLLVTNADNLAERERENIESLLDSQVDGLLVNTTGNNYKYLQEFKDSDNFKPIVLLDRFINPLIYDSVTMNNAEVTKNILDELLKNDYDHYVYFSEDINGISSRIERKKAMEEFLSRNANTSGETNIIKKNDIKEIKESIENILNKNKDKNICFFANNDEILKVLIECLYDLNIRIGVDIGIFGFAEEKWARLIGPGITSIDENPYEMGERAAKLLFERIDGSRKDDFVLEEIPVKIHLNYSTRNIKK
ncbi:MULTISPECIES: LacI family DNA-binding transcriptional regulator [Clostridium]|uniref:LacI family transcriptional regulator n=1 Tax=Clostridium beijerinckii TaxID=1520 RepID=A0A1S9NBI3_CLOBE|nr:MULTISPECIES: LacI family DNA-binding transcriptional regulator [Clostridium]MBN7576183.1 LacI family DNA-binding transcriptional regulator [Clostridium beijerinckii]MBN7582142.1 LacI family DNA-binding transcriptional regulator [Clostridium beijerinckii]MBN7585953.1 LacI family DNA-binding transcriptional regulator [Clostridium beijerinckii]MZK54058.1 substrate-binding domain-containing protein [Clostridium beijerinckii]MZK62142.1 substrate-binding domain-containing protein [Clostridium be